MIFQCFYTEVGQIHIDFQKISSIVDLLEALEVIIQVYLEFQRLFSIIRSYIGIKKLKKCKEKNFFSQFVSIFINKNLHFG